MEGQIVECVACRACGHLGHLEFSDEGGVFHVECDCGVSGPFADTVVDAGVAWNEMWGPGEATGRYLDQMKLRACGDVSGNLLAALRENGMEAKG